MLKHGSLFSGIGGFDLAAQWAGWKNIFHCEINPFGQKVLSYYWPNSIQYHDITKTDFTIHRGNIDILTGGFPCQPYSASGKRLGKEDERHLWPEMLRAIREISPRWVVGENVLGITNWSGGLVFEEVQIDLETSGYEVQTYVLPACGVNAPHKRDRVWFVAYSRLFGQKERQQKSMGINELCKERTITNSNINSTRSPGTSGSIESNRGRNNDESEEWRSKTELNPGSPEFLRNASDTMHNRSQRSIFTGKDSTEGWENENRHLKERLCFNRDGIQFDNFPTQSPIRSRNDGFSRPLVRYITKELYDEISNTSEENRVKDLPEMWNRISQEEVWKKIRGFYSLESKEILFQTMQLYQRGYFRQDELSPFSEIVSKGVLSKLRKYGEFRCSPQGQKLEKQRAFELGDIVSYLPHEIPLAARTFESAMAKFETWHRNESIKAYGNAIVPQVVYQIFKSINQFESKITKT